MYNYNINPYCMYVYSAFNDNVFVYDRKYPSYYFQRKTATEKGILVNISIYIILALPSKIAIRP